MGNGLGTGNTIHHDTVQRFGRADSNTSVKSAGASTSRGQDQRAPPVRRVMAGPLDDPFEDDDVVPGGLSKASQLETEAPESADDLMDDGYFNVQERILYEGDLETMPTRQSTPAEWKRGDVIGSGAFGSVYVALNVDTGELIAVKSVPIFPSSDGEDSKRMNDLQTEINLMGKLDHPNIVRYLGTSTDKQNFNILMEFVPGGSIASMLKNFGVFDEIVVSRYSQQILDGLHYLHSYRIVHRDIKGANILIDSSGVIKLADFGASKQVADLVYRGNGHVSLRGTPYWMAPEVSVLFDRPVPRCRAFFCADVLSFSSQVIRQTGHGRQADIWSLGCTIVEMATGKPPWSQYTSQVAAMFQIAVSEDPPQYPVCA